MARSFLANGPNVQTASDSLNPAGSLTICAWARTSSVCAGFSRLVSNRDTGSVGYLMGLDTTGAFMRFLIAVGGTFRVLTGTTTITDGAWHFYVATYTAGATDEYRLYVDDMVTAEATRSVADGTYTAASQPFTAGNDPAAAGVQHWHGDMGEVSVFNAALSVGQREAVKMHGPMHLGVKPALYWPLGVGSPEPDWSGNGLAGTVTGATVADNPPVGLPFGFDLAWPWAEAIAVVLQRYRSASLRILVALAAGDVVRLRTKRDSGTDTIYTVADGSGLTIRGPLGG